LLSPLDLFHVVCSVDSNYLIHSFDLDRSRVQATLSRWEMGAPDHSVKIGNGSICSRGRTGTCMYCGDQWGRQQQGTRGGREKIGLGCLIQDEIEHT